MKKEAFLEWSMGKRTSFGDHAARRWVLDWLPGAHGSNRTGRMFTGDASGDFSILPCTGQALPASRTRPTG